MAAAADPPAFPSIRHEIPDMTRIPAPRLRAPSRRAAATLALMGLLVGAAQAQLLMQPGPRSDRSDADTLLWRAGLQWQHDDNVFRQPDAQARSDQLRVSTLGLSLNKPWSLQRLEIDLDLAAHRYERYGALDFTALNYTGAFQWALTPRLRGQLRADRREYSDLFSDVSADTVNRRTEQNLGLEAEYEVGAAWRALAGVFERRVNNRVDALEPDVRVRGGELGVRHEWRSGSSLAWRLRQGRGEYAGAALSAGDFTDWQQELELRLQPTGQLRMSGRLGWLDREHELQAQRDFSGWTGRLDATWALTGKTSVQAGLARELAAYQTSEASYYQGLRGFLEPQWKPSAKTAVRLRWEHGTRTYKGAPLPVLQSMRKDRLDLLALGLEWQPLRALALLATVQQERRHTHRDVADDTARMYGMSARVSF